VNIFLTSQASNVLEKVVSLLPNVRKVAFIPTAAKPYPDAPWMRIDRDRLVSLGLEVADLDLDTASREETKNAVESADAIFVGGGNTFYLLEKVKKTGFGEVVKNAIAKGKTYIGSSAGSIIAGPDIESVESLDDRSKANLENTIGMGLVNFAVLPHFDSPKYKERNEKILEKYKNWSYKTVPLNDNQFVVPKGDTWQILTV